MVANFWLIDAYKRSIDTLFLDDKTYRQDVRGEEDDEIFPKAVRRLDDLTCPRSGAIEPRPCPFAHYSDFGFIPKPYGILPLQNSGSLCPSHLREHS